MKRYGPPQGSKKSRGRKDNRPRKGRKLTSPWIRGVKGCIVCGRPHRANFKQFRDEVNTAVAKLKKKHPTALLTVSDNAFITELSLGDQTESDDDLHAEWAQDGSDGETDFERDLSYIVIGSLEEVEESLSEAAFLYGISIAATKKDDMHVYLGSSTGKGFDGVRIETCCNKRSVMSLAQYPAYCSELGLIKTLL